MSAALKLKEIKNKVKSKYLLYYFRSRYTNVFNKKADRFCKTSRKTPKMASIFCKVGRL